jgi:hypothetical protein
MSGSVRPYAAFLPQDVSFMVSLQTLLFHKRGVQLGKISSNLNHSEVILFTVYHAWMNDILLEIV